MRRVAIIVFAVFLLLTGLTHLRNHSEAEAGEPRSFKSNKRLAQAKVDKKYGYIDKTGKIVIEPKFEEANDFSEGPARRFSGGPNPILNLAPTCRGTFLTRLTGLISLRLINKIFLYSLYPEHPVYPV